MKILIEASDQIVRLNGVECRVWHGTTDDGTPCRVFVHRVAVREDLDRTRFEAELQEKLPPGRHIDLRMVL